MSDLDELVSVTIEVDSTGIAREGFGLAMILSHNAATVFAGDMIRYYDSLADVLSDFPAGSPEAIAAASLFSQSPHPSQISIGSATAASVTLTQTLGVVTVTNSRKYVVNVVGQGVTPTSASYTSDSTATNDEIAAGLVAALNAVGGRNFTASVTGGTGSEVVAVVGNTPGAWFALEVVDRTALSLASTSTGDPTADLAAIDLHADPDFYAVHTLYPGAAYIAEVAAWCEANGKLYVFDTSDTKSVSQTKGNGDPLDVVFSHGYTRTLGNFHPRGSEMLSAAIEGKVLPLNPGLWTAAFQSLAGPTPVKLTATERANLKSKRSNYYTTRGGRSCTLYGYVGSSVYGFLDTVVGLDYFLNNVQATCAGILIGSPYKIGYDDADIEQFAAAIRGCIADAAGPAHKIISLGTPGSLTDPPPTVTFPKVADIDPSVRQLRNLPNGVINFRLLGAIQSIAMAAVVTF